MKITETLKIIKKIVADPDNIDAHDPLTVATTYKGQCEVVNERLKKCVALIQSNMVPQALQEAEYDPHLIDLCHEMNSPAPAAWRKLCKEKSMPVPEELDMDSFNQLMKSFSMESKIEPMLKLLRRANNLGQAGQCVAILRELVKKDPANPQWKSDLAEFEASYLELIKQDIAKFKQEKNLNGIARLIVELKQQWSTPIDSLSVKELEEFIEEQYRIDIHKEEEDIVGRVGISFQSGNIEALGKAIGEYNNLEKNRYFKADPSLQIIYANALNWYEQQVKALEIQKGYYNRLKEISARVETQSYDGIKSLWEEVKLYRLPIPKELEPEVKALIQKEDRAKKRRQVRKQMGYILILIFAMVAIGIAATLNYYRQIRNRLSEELSNAVVTENILECNRVIEDMSKRRTAFINTAIFTSSEMQKHQEMAKGVASILEQKKATFGLVISELESLKSDNFPKPTKDIERLMENINKTLNAVTPHDLARLKLVQSAWEERKAVIRAMEEKRLTEIFEQINSNLKNILSGANQEEQYKNSQTLLLIEESIAEGEKLTSVSDSMKKSLDEFKSQVKGVQEILAVKKSQFKNIMDTSSLDSYIKELKTFAQTFSDDPVSQTLLPIIEMENLYKALLESPPTIAEEAGLKSDTKSDSELENLFWSKTFQMLTALNNNIKLHSPEVQEELRKMSRTSRFVDLWECTVKRPNFEPEKWYFNGRPSEEFINGIKSYAGIVYVLSPDDMQPQFKANSAITVQVQDLRKMEHCDVILQAINNISYNIGMESTLQEMKRIYSEPFSPILKLHIISFLTDQLFTLVGEEDALPFADMAKDFKRFNKRSVEDQVNWLCTAHNRYPSESRLAQAILSRHLERPDNINSHVINWKIRELSLKRIPKWVGFADLKNPEQLHLKRGSMPKELWVVRQKVEEDSAKSSKTITPMIFITQEQKGLESIKHLEHGGYLPGEPLFAPYDNNTTSELLQSIIDSINSGKVPVNIEWSTGWPINGHI
ncbi:MAG: hypothetical protein HQK74_05145 [Desulfamplus sp.]|nr:hypothetical protein [Desulfamplus sp.]